MLMFIILVKLAVSDMYENMDVEVELVWKKGWGGKGLLIGDI